jgi:hypothetical protein
MYNIRYSMIDIFVDNHFVFTYILKVLNYLIFYISVYFAEKIFTEMYMKTVYADNKDPPNLLTLYGIVLGISIALNIFMITVLILVMYIVKLSKDGSSYVITPELIFTYLKDYFILTVLSTSLLCVIGYMMQIKKYFRYKTEGLRAIRAYKESMLIIYAILTSIPYFAIL